MVRLWRRMSSRHWNNDISIRNLDFYCMTRFWFQNLNHKGCCPLFTKSEFQGSLYKISHIPWISVRYKLQILITNFQTCSPENQFCKEEARIKFLNFPESAANSPVRRSSVVTYPNWASSHSVTCFSIASPYVLMILSLLTKIYQSQFLQIKDLVHCSSVVTSHNWARQVATPSPGFQSIDTVSQSEKNVQVVQPSHPISNNLHPPHPSVQYQNENRLTNRCWYWTGGERAFKLRLYVSFQVFFCIRPHWLSVITSP